VRELVDVGVGAALHQSQGARPTFRRAVSRRAGPGLTSDSLLGQTCSLPNSPVTSEACVQKRGFVCAHRMERYLDPDLHHSRTHDPPQSIYLLVHVLFEVSRPILHYPSQ
jgi:hypothetical protein